jgi:periplasmic protein TonB
LELSLEIAMYPYIYEEPSLFSGKRGIFLLPVVVLHIGLGYALLNGLTDTIVQIVTPDVVKREIEQTKSPGKPPTPPKPIFEQVEPIVRQLERLDFQGPVDPDAMVQHPANSPTETISVRPIVRIGVRVDPRYPLHIGEEYYPDQSKRLGEQGTCRVSVRVKADGRVVDATLKQRSGFPRLDDACLRAVQGRRMLPATEDGKPVASVAVLPIRWQLRTDR